MIGALDTDNPLSYKSDDKISWLLSNSSGSSNRVSDSVWCLKVLIMTDMSPIPNNMTIKSMIKKEPHEN